MKVVEFRLVLPLTPEEYRRCQIFLVALAALETAEAQKATGGPPKTPMIEVLASEDYQQDGEEGQFTHKRIDLAEWNAFPRLRTQYEVFVALDESLCSTSSLSHLKILPSPLLLSSTKFSKAKVSITSNHISGVCTDDNALRLSPEKLRQRQVDLIDIVNDGGPQPAGASDDLRNWRSQKAGFGPLKSDWFKNVPLVPRRPPRPLPRSRLREGAPVRGKEEGPLSGEGGPNNAAEQGSNQEPSSPAPTTGAPPHQPQEEPSSGAPPSLAAGAADGKEGPLPGEGGGPSVPDGGPLGDGGPPSEGPPPPLEPAYPLMTCYKCFEVHFPYFGLLAGRIEAWVVSSMREQLMQYHRKAIACIDRWYDMSLEEVRKFEDDVRQQLAVLAALSRDAAAGGPPPQGASQGDTAGAPPQEEGSRRTSVTAEAQASSDSEGDVEGPHVGGPSQQLLEALEDPRIYTGARLLPLRLSPQSVSLLQRLQKSILSNPPPDKAQLSPPSQQQQQQQQQQKQQQQGQGGPPLRPSGSFRVSGDLQEGGPLKKEGPTRHGFLDKLADGYWGSGWNARYFLLRGPRLQYFDDPRDAKAKQSFILTGATADWVDDMKERPYTFYVEAPGRKRLILCGGTEEESLAWLSAIQSAALIGTPAATSSSSSSSSKEYRRSEQQEDFARGSLSFAELPGVGGPLGPPAPLTETPLDLIASFPLSPAGPGEPPEGPKESRGRRASEHGPQGAPIVKPAAEAASQEASQDNRAPRGTLASTDKESQSHDEALQQQIHLLKEPLKNVIVAVTRRCPRGRSFRGEGLGAPHAVFLEEPEQRGAPVRGPSAKRLRDRDLWEVVEATEEKREQPSVTEEAATLGFLAFGVLLLLLSAAAACCCCSSVLSFFCFATVAVLRLLLATSGLSSLLNEPFFLLGEGGPSGSIGAPVLLSEALRSLAAAVAAALLLRSALWVLAGVACKSSEREEEEGPGRGLPVLKVACLAEGAPTSLLLSALPPDATPAALAAAAGGSPDPSILAAGGPFLMEASETVYPLELLLSDVGAACCLCWGSLRRCLPRFFDAPLAFSLKTEGPGQQRQLLSSGLRSSSNGSKGKLAAAKQVLLLLLRLLRLIASKGALALGGALGALLAALSGAPLGPLRLRRVLWCVSLEGGGYLLLSLLSPEPSKNPGGPSQGSGASQWGAPGGEALWDLFMRGALAALRLTAPSLFRVSPTGGPSGGPSEGPVGSFIGVEGLLITPVALNPEEAHHVGHQWLQQLQQQQRWSLTSLRFEGAPVASAEGPVSGAPLDRGSTAARGASYSVSERGRALAATTLKSGAPEELLEGPPVLPTQGAVSEGLCLLNWVGGPFQSGGPRGAPRWLEALLTLRRAETALGSLLSQVGAQRSLHEVGPYHLGESRASAAGAPLKKARLSGPPQLSSSCGDVGGRQGSPRELEGPLTEFYKTAGALEAPVARSLAKKRAQQRWRMERDSSNKHDSSNACGSSGEGFYITLRAPCPQALPVIRLAKGSPGGPPAEVFSPAVSVCSLCHCLAGAPLPTSVLLPIGMLRPASVLALLPECCSQGPPLLESAVAGGPLDKFKATVAFAVSLLHRGCWQAPPFAACLGETIQGHFQGPAGHLASPHGGWLVYAEQTSVGPPSTLFCLSHPAAPMRVWGHLAFHTAYQQNKCWIFVNGRISVSFQEGETISFSLPQLHIEGLLWGPRVFSWRGPLVVEGPTMRCTLTLGGGPSPGSGVPLDEIFGHVERIGGSQLREKKGGDSLEETPSVDAILTGAYTDKVFWNDEAFRTDCLLLSLGYEETADALRRKTLETEAADDVKTPGERNSYSSSNSSSSSKKRCGGLRGVESPLLQHQQQQQQQQQQARAAPLSAATTAVDRFSSIRTSSTVGSVRCRKELTGWL
ncbi:hypothetical protein Emed_003760 [Eimeria media]